MELGEKIRQARLAAGLSQRQLCGEEITRNMLSLIENGSAKPSMKTLAYLASQLGKPLSWFLDDQSEQERQLAQGAELLRRAGEALGEGKQELARELLTQLDCPPLNREKWLLMAKLPGANPVEICKKLPSLDEELLLRARAALETGGLGRCESLLNAVEHPDSSWMLLAGRLCIAQKDYSKAAEHLKQAPDTPETWLLLETAFREMGDFRNAYEYACRRMEKG